MTGTPDPIHTDPTVQSIDIRLYFSRTTASRAELLRAISTLLQEAPELDGLMINAYELAGNGFGGIVPAGLPLA